MSTAADRLAQALERWRSNLIDLTRRNPLLNLKANATSYLDIKQPELMNVHASFVAGQDWRFFLPGESDQAEKKDGPKSTAPKVSDPTRPAPDSQPPIQAGTSPPVSVAVRSNELLTGATDRPSLLRILTNLYRRALTDYRERGLHTLHLALGVLEWRDEDNEVYRSPILLLPVQLQRHSLKDPFVLRGVDEEPIVNPALVLRLKQDFDFKLPALPADWEEKKPVEYLDEVTKAIAGLPGWRVEACTVLTLFSFFKGVILQDLQDNAVKLQEHALVQALAGTPSAATNKQPQPLDRLDDEDPRGIYHILDADSSQRLCLSAAVRGESFVLIGPPGTGKSQTIANLIADCIARGKKVLFVSEKMAALEVVYKRLRAVGLEEFCLELHSHKANKREVVKELARCFQEKLAPRAQPSADDYARLQERRAQLNGYVNALHQVRQPMKKAVWEVLAELPRLAPLPMIPLGLHAVRQAGDVATKTLAEFEAKDLDELQQMLQRVQHHWHIRTDKNYPWRGFKADRYSLQLRDDVVSLIDKIRARGDKLHASAEDYAQQLGLRGSIAGLLKLGDLLEKRPPGTLSAWLTMPDLAGFNAEFEKCADQYTRLGEARKPLTERHGSALWKLPGGTAVKIEDAWKHAAALLASGDGAGAGFIKLQQKLRAWTAETQKRIPGWLTEVRALEKWLPIPLPIGAGSNAVLGAGESRLDPSIASLRAYARLANLGVSDAPFDKAWLEDRETLKGALELIASSKAAFARYKQNRAYLLKLYDAKLFDLDLARIGQAYAGPYQRWWCVFSWQYRKDRRAIAKCRPMEDLPRSVAQDMQLGAQLHADRARLNAEAAQRARVLGRYDKGLETDVEASDKASRHAAEALELLSYLECDKLPPKAGEALTTASAPEKIRAAVKRLNESFIVWAHLTQEVQSVLPMALLPQMGVPLEEASLSALGHYAKDLQTALNQYAGLADALHGAAPPADMRAFVSDLKQAEELLAFEAAQASEAERWSRQLGPAFEGVSTNWAALKKALAWTGRLRETAASSLDPGMPIPDALIRAASGAPPSARELHQAYEQYQHILHSFEIRFDAPGPLLEGKPLREQSPEPVLELLTKMRERVGELADWVDWRFLPERFAHLGLKAFWDHLQEHEIARAQVIDLFLKSFWSAWVDAMFQIDPTLGRFRRAEHEDRLNEFRELDRRLLEQGAARIVAILDPLQSKPKDDGEITLLMKEAHKKTRHLPLRELFDRIPSVLLHLKPCMLMSPLSVSQYLPADRERFGFDVVVFDEASQILPEDALGAIYRGRQLVVTGDNQQLPPTNFFQQQLEDAQDEEETPLFESVLDTCLGAGMQQRGLRWHYRSQHEHLIAFSNETYYDGGLFTFPSAWFQRTDLGVCLEHVQDAVYDRGGKRDNLKEAQAVAQHVLEHFRQSPDKTLGVIAFSYAQMNAIEDELERLLAPEPELQRLLKEDRLEGFFVKNLETVQGDERDVIFLSVGYGRDAQGKIELNFGPLNREGGERRLNVAVTRARQRLVVVSSIRAADLTLGNSRSKGLAHLQRFLAFAELGLRALNPEEATVPLKPSALHEDISSHVQKLGFETSYYVGCGSCRIDIGVRSRADAGRYVLGIELDGPMHAQAATARDRERIRPEVLSRLGWKLHRIWAADWVYRKEEEISRLRAALTSAR